MTVMGHTEVALQGVLSCALKRLRLLLGRKHESSRGKSSIEFGRLVTVLDQVAEGLWVAGKGLWV